MVEDEHGIHVCLQNMEKTYDMCLLENRGTPKMMVNYDLNGHFRNLIWKYPQATDHCPLKTMASTCEYSLFSDPTLGCTTLSYCDFKLSNDHKTPVG